MENDQIPPSGAIAVPLTRGWVAWVDIAAIPLLGSFSWSTKLSRGTAYAVRCERGKARTERRKTIYMHHVVIGHTTEVDHVEHRANIKVVDNRRKNLRLCTHAENGRNRRKGKGTASSFKGVTRTRSLWQARIMLAGKVHQLGCFREETQAALAYDEAARRLHGEFARTNF